MFSFFKKKSKQNLQDFSSIPEAKKPLIHFDPTNRGEFADAEPARLLSLEELRKPWEAALDRWHGQAVFFLPREKYNSYSYVTFDQAADWGIKDEHVSVMKNWLGSSGGKSCLRCSKKGKYLLINEAFPVKGKIDEMTAHDHAYCASCLLDDVLPQMQRPGMNVEEVNTPYGDKGVYLAGGY